MIFARCRQEAMTRRKHTGYCAGDHRRTEELRDEALKPQPRLAGALWLVLRQVARHPRVGLGFDSGAVRIAAALG